MARPSRSRTPIGGRKGKGKYDERGKGMGGGEGKGGGKGVNVTFTFQGRRFRVASEDWGPWSQRSCISQPWSLLFERGGHDGMILLYRLLR